MKLHSPPFQQQLRRKVKAAIRRSRSLRKEYRRASKFRRRTRLGWLGRLVVCFGFGMVVSGATAATHHAVTGLAAIALWLFAWIFLRAQTLWTVLHTHSDIMALRLLPVPESRIFRWQLQKFLRKAAFSLLDLVAGIGAIGLFSGFTPARWGAAALIVMLAWATLLALAVLCVAHVPRPVCQIVASSLTTAGFLLLVLNQVLAKPLLALLDHTASDLILVIPTGWPVALFQLLLRDPPWSTLLLLAPTGLLLWSLKNSLRRLFDGFRPGDTVLPVAPDLLPASEAEDAGSIESGSRFPERVGPSDIEEIIRSGRFLTPVSWRQLGWIENLLWRWLNSRERALCEFVFPSGCAIVRPWRRILRNLLFIMLAAFALGLASPVLKVWILGLGAMVTGFPALGRVGDSGAAFRSLFCSGVNVPIYAHFGVGYRELAGLLVKYSAVQLPFFVPFVCVWSLLITRLNGLSWQTGVVFGLKAAMLLFGARFIFIVLGFSGSSNDSSRLRARNVLLILLVLSLGITFVGLGAAGLLVPTPATAWLLCGLAIFDAYLMFRVYGWFHNANCFDLMSLPRA